MKIGFIGAGNMAEAIIKGIIKSRISRTSEIYASDINQDRLKYIKKLTGINVFNDNLKVIKNSDIIILCVKPQNIDNVLSELKNKIDKRKKIISIAAGISLSRLQIGLGKNISIIRVMPNTPALIGEGMSCISHGRYTSKKDIKIASGIFSSLGKVILIKEKLMDAVTAISGSGPAYFYLFIEALINAGIKLGLPYNVAVELVNQTAFGSIKMVINTKEEPANLREKVTSKGGTTEAALKIFAEKEFEKIVEDAVQKAFLRSKELSKGGKNDEIRK